MSQLSFISAGETPALPAKAHPRQIVSLTSICTRAQLDYYPNSDSPLYDPEQHTGNLDLVGCVDF
jgi:hypothetical protein